MWREEQIFGVLLHWCRCCCCCFFSFFSFFDILIFFSCAHFYLGVRMYLCVYVFAKCKPDSARKMDVYFIKVLYFNVKKLITFFVCQRKFHPYTLCVLVYELALFAFYFVYNWILCWFCGKSKWCQWTRIHSFLCLELYFFGKCVPHFFPLSNDRKRHPNLG